MGIMRDLKNIEGSAAATAALATAEDVKLLAVVELLKMNWPTLDKRSAATMVDKWLKHNGLGGR